MLRLPTSAFTLYRCCNISLVQKIYIPKLPSLALRLREFSTVTPPTSQVGGVTTSTTSTSTTSQVLSTDEFEIKNALVVDIENDDDWLKRLRFGVVYSIYSTLFN